jgi:predicted O-methyltransferase YrrM
MNKINFTYNNTREELKQCFLEKPFSCTYGWIINWINLEISKLPQGSLILEMGTFVGGSTCLLAKDNQHVIIHTIDLNKFEENNHMLESMRSSHNLPLLTSLDLLEIQKMHIEDFPNIIPHTGDSKSLDLKDLSVVFIDAGHSEDEVTADLNYAWDRLLDGGCIFGDDINSPMVYNAFTKFARTKDVELTLYSKCARIRKTDKISPDIRFFDFELSSDILIAKF